MSARRSSSDDTLAAIIAEQAMGNVPRLPANIAHDIAEDVLSAMRKVGLQARPYGGNGQRTPPPPPGTICVGICGRPLYTLTHIGGDRSRLPEGAATHHARGRCNSCDGKDRRRQEKEGTE